VKFCGRFSSRVRNEKEAEHHRGKADAAEEIVGAVRSQADNEEWKDLDDRKYDAAGNASNNSGRKTLDLKYSREIN